MSAWISVEDRLPEHGQGVLIFASGDVQTASFDKEGYWHGFDYVWYASEVKHWMPLPPPPA